jgi:chaperonin cofactor prefoldin
MKKPLGLILQEKAFLEAEIEEAGGEITEELDQIWESNQMELAEKVDNYAWVLKHLDSVIANIKERKQKADKIIKSITSHQERIKRRLHHYTQEIGGPLRGHEYSFHPYMSRKSEVSQDKVEDPYVKVSVTASLSDWRLISESIKNHLAEPVSVKVERIPVKVSDLPKDHPAILVDEKPSVTMR